MFIQRKKVALLLLIFIAIPIMIAFSAFKLSASKAAIAADENKTEYTLSDFGVTVPDDGIDFSDEYNSDKPLFRVGKSYVDESKSFDFSFVLGISNFNKKQSLIVGFAGTVSLKITIATGRKLTAFINDGSNIIEPGSNLNSILFDYEFNKPIAFKFSLKSGNSLSFYLTYANKTYGIEELSCKTISSPTISLYCENVSGAKLYDAYHSVTANNGRGTTAEITVDHGDVLDEASLPATESYEENGETHNFLGWKCDGATFDLSTPIIKNIEIIAEYDSNVAEETLVTVLDENGEEISKIDKTTLSYEEITGRVQTPEKRFIGFEYDGKLYQTISEIEDLNKDDTVIARTITLYMEYGACIRTIEPFGIRFAAVASYSVVDYGIMLTTKDIAKNSDLFTLENLENSGVKFKIACKSQSDFKELLDKETGLSNFAIALVGVREENYNLVFAARAFAKIKYCNGDTKTIYSDFSADNCRSIYDVAKVGLEKDEFNRELYRKYCDGVIDIKIEGETPSLLYSSNLYTAELLKEGGQLTITLKSNTTDFKVASIKCITINGKRIVGFKYDGGKIQIDITEFLS